MIYAGDPICLVSRCSRNADAELLMKNMWVEVMRITLVSDVLEVHDGRPWR